MEYVGGYADHLRQSGARRTTASATVAEPRPPAATNAEPRKPSGGQKKLSYHEVRELAALPARIEALEAEQAQLQAEAASPDFYKHSAEHIRNVLARIDAIAPLRMDARSTSPRRTSCCAHSKRASTCCSGTMIAQDTRISLIHFSP